MLMDTELRIQENYSVMSSHSDDCCLSQYDSCSPGRQSAGAAGQTPPAFCVRDHPFNLKITAVAF